MIRKIIKINPEKCNGCSLCAEACHEGAISIVDRKAVLLRDDYCDGLGNCLPVCPTGAITFEEREAVKYNEEEVFKNMAINKKESLCECLGTHTREIKRNNETQESNQTKKAKSVSLLTQWPVQIKLIPRKAPYFDGANLLIAADCAAYAHANFHEDFVKNKISLIGCPKLDDVDYSEKLTEILSENDIKSVTVARIEVPCCAGIEKAVMQALIKCGKMIQWQVITISIDGNVVK